MKHHMIVIQHLLGEYVHYRIFIPSPLSEEVVSQEGVTTFSSIEKYFIGTHYHETEYIENMRRFTTVSLREDRSPVHGIQLLNKGTLSCELWKEIEEEARESRFMNCVSLVRYIHYSDIYPESTIEEGVLVELLVLGEHTDSSRLFKTNLFYEQDVPLTWSDGLLGERYPHLREVISKELSPALLDMSVMRCLLFKS